MWICPSESFSSPLNNSDGEPEQIDIWLSVNFSTGVLFIPESRMLFGTVPALSLRKNLFRIQTDYVLTSEVGFVNEPPSKVRSANIVVGPSVPIGKKVLRLSVLTGLGYSWGRARLATGADEGFISISWDSKDYRAVNFPFRLDFTNPFFDHYGLAFSVSADMSRKVMVLLGNIGMTFGGFHDNSRKLYLQR